MYKKLRLFRIIFSIIFFIIITIGFLSFNGGNNISAYALKTQFIPSLISIFTGGFLAFLLLIILTLLFGRVYCSFLCPLGILQDIIGFISKKVQSIYRKKVQKKNGKIKSKYHKPLNILRYSILIIASIFFAAGITYPIAILDPYSNYGRIACKLFGSLEIAISNGLSNILPDTFFYQQFVTYTLYSFVYTGVFFIIIAIFSALRGRLYCNSICPVGTLLGAVSGFSMLKPIIKKDMCVKCTACVSECKSDCINLETKEIDISRCVSCYNCMTSCGRGGVQLHNTWFKKKEKVEKQDNRNCENLERRNAIIAFGALGATLITAKLTDKGLRADEKTAQKVIPIAPPGAGSIEHLKDHCTGCHACIAACPNKIIKPATMQYGLDGFMLPTITFENKFCAYDCNLCTQTCPHGALSKQSLEDKQRTQIGKAVYKAKNCIVFTDETDCGACDEHCPTKAITMTPLKNKEWLSFPKLNKDICIGCGACEYICPARPKALVVNGNRIQTRSQKPKVEKQEEVEVKSFGF